LSGGLYSSKGEREKGGSYMVYNGKPRATSQERWSQIFAPSVRRHSPIPILAKEYGDFLRQTAAAKPMSFVNALRIGP